MMALLIGYCVMSPSGSGGGYASSAGGGFSPAYSDVQIELAKDVVRARLKDPGSAQFEGVQLGHTMPGGTATVCGMVNSKNSFGGFTGAQRFVVVGTDVFVEEQRDKWQFVDRWVRACAPKPSSYAEAVQLPPTTTPGDTLTVVGEKVRLSRTHQSWRTTFASLKKGARVVVVDEFVTEGRDPLRRIKVRTLGGKPIVGWVHAYEVGISDAMSSFNP